MTTPYLHPKMKYTFVGCDSHKKTHTLVFLNCFYEPLGELVISNTPSDFKAFLKQASKFMQPDTEFCFGFEDVSVYGRSLIKFLLQQPYLVKHTNASLVASERRSTNTLNKNDSIDALCCARVLINRFDSLPVVSVNDPLFILRSLVSRRKSMVKINGMLKNHLHTLLADHYPTYPQFFHDLTTKSALAFFEAYPSPMLLTSSSMEAVEELLYTASSGKIGQKKAQKQAQAIWHAVNREGVEPFDYQEQRDFTICSIIRQLQNNLHEIERIETHLGQFLDLLDIPLTSMKGIDTVLACRLINEIGDIHRFKNPASLAKYAGIAPVTYASGSSHVEYANKRGNRELSAIFYQLAISLTMPRGAERQVLNPFFHEYYHRKLSEGKTTKQALKCVQRRLVNVIYGIMKYKQDYINPPVMYEDKENKQELKLTKKQATFKS